MRCDTADCVDAAVVRRDQAFCSRSTTHRVLAAIYSRDDSLIFLSCIRIGEFYLIVRFSWRCSHDRNDEAACRNHFLRGDAGGLPSLIITDWLHKMRLRWSAEFVAIMLCWWPGFVFWPTPFLITLGVGGAGKVIAQSTDIYSYY